jgi:hypothetical protein
LTSEHERIVGDVWNALEPGGWDWEHLTSGEQNQFGAEIRRTIRGLLEAGYEIKRPGCGVPGCQEHIGDPIIEDDS